MRLIFKDGKIRELPFNAELGAKLIHLAQERDDPDYKLELDPDLPFEEKKKQTRELQAWADAYRLHDRCKL